MRQIQNSASNLPLVNIPLVYFYIKPRPLNLLHLREKTDKLSFKDYVQEIDKLRIEMEDISLKEGSLNSPLVLQASQRLDDLISSYYKNINKIKV